MTSVPLDNLSKYDAVMILADHTGIDWAKVVTQAPLVVDTRNATRAVRAQAKATIVGL